MADSGQFQSAQGGGEHPFVSPEEEIKELERRLAEKKRVFAEAARGAPEGAPRLEREEKELFREVIRERAEEARPSGATAREPLISALKPADPPAPLARGAHNQRQADEREEELKALVEFALSHTIRRAVEKAEAESPYLLDALHDRLADEYYEKMVALRKLKSL